MIGTCLADMRVLGRTRALAGPFATALPGVPGAEILCPGLRTLSTVCVAHSRLLRRERSA